MLRLAGKLCTAALLPPSMMALKEATTTDSTPSSSLLSHLFTVTLQHQIDVHRAEDQYSSLTGIYLFHITSPGWSSPLFWTVDLSVGLAYEGKPRGGEPPLTTYLIEAQDLVELLNGRLNTAHAYLSGKLKLLGNTAAAFKFQHFLNETLKQQQQPDSAEEEEKNKMHSTTSSLLSGIPSCGLKCDVIFELIKSRLSAESALVASVPPFVVQVNVLKAKTPVTSWTIDTRTPGGLVYRGEASSGAAVDATLSVEDDDYISLLFGRLNPQRAFLKGLLKVKGNILLLQRLDQLWARLQKSRADPELPLLKELLLETQLEPGLLSETVFFEVITRLARAPELLPPATSVRFSVTQKGTLVAQWVLSTDSAGQLMPVKHQTRGGGRGDLIPIAGPTDLELVMEDEELAMLTRQQSSLQEAIASRRVEATGDRSLLPRLSALFMQTPAASASSSVLKAKL